MPRIKRGVTTRAKHKRLLDQAKGYRGRRKNTIRIARQAVGYKELLDVVSGNATLEEGRAAAIQATIALAKRQRTFFRRDPRLHWLSPDLSGAAAFDAACEIIEQHRKG